MNKVYIEKSEVNINHWLSAFYTKLTYVYQYKQNHENQEAQRLAYVAIRNVLGFVLFSIVLTVQTLVDNFIFSFSPFIRSLHPLKVMLPILMIILLYLYAAKTYLRPKLTPSSSVAKSSKKLTEYNRLYWTFVVGSGLFAGAVFIFNRLIYIYF